MSKGLGIVNQIIDILRQVHFGTHYFEIAVALREALLVNGVLTNSEVWYGLTRSDINKLEDVDKLFLRQLFHVPISCPTESLYLETGIIPWGIVIKARRVKYFHHLLTRNSD